MQHFDNSHMINVSPKERVIRINNGADPVLLTRTFNKLQEFCFTIIPLRFLIYVVSPAISYTHEHLYPKQVSLQP